MTVQQWSTLAASNNSAPPTGAPEGQSPGSLNNVLREMMASIATEAQVNRVKVLNSVAGTNTITGSMTPALAAYSAGMMVILTPANSNTGATTLNINSLGALDVLNSKGQALSGGELVSGIPSLLVLDSGADDFVLVGPVPSSGTFTAILSGTSGSDTGGFVSNPSGTINYRVANGLCTLWRQGGDISGTSTNGNLFLRGLPSICQPTIVSYIRTTALSQSQVCGAIAVPGAGATLAEMTIYAEQVASTYLVTGSFASSSFKGIPNSWSITYPL